jgi:hypothetical protein
MILIMRLAYYNLETAPVEVILIRREPHGCLNINVLVLDGNTALDISHFQTQL